MEVLVGCRGARVGGGEVDAMLPWCNNNGKGRTGVGSQPGGRRLGSDMVFLD
jgi:hypothetical protein